MNSKTEVPILEAGAFVVKNFKTPPPGARRVEVTPEMAASELFGFCQHLIRGGRELWAAKILWPDGIFTTEPNSVKQIWEALPLTSELLIMGAGSMGKSYTLAAWLIMDWLADPEWTCIKVISLTAGHAKKNVFANMKNLLINSRIPIPHTKPDMITDSSVMVNMDEKQGIHLLAVPKGESGRGRLRGFHPVPRPEPHPKYGTHSRVRAVLDEAEEIAPGVWQDIDNLLLSKSGVEQIKVIGATNPVDINSIFASKAEPKAGWDSLKMDSSFKWKSKANWDVVRIDGAQCENVLQKKIIYQGLLTWEGYERYLQDGEANPDYFTMARGWYPVKGLHMNVIPPDFISRNVGTVQFMGPTIFCAAVDLALEGGDRAIMTIGRFGRAHGWTNLKGEPLQFPESKIVIQIESFFELPKGDTDTMTKGIMAACKNLSITPQWLGVDRTGNGAGVHDMLKMNMGPEVLGVDYSAGSTETKVLQEDTFKCSESYSGIVTELFFAMRKYLEFDHLKFSPYLKMEKLRPELSGRRFGPHGKMLVRVESKKDFKARGHKSPDYADSTTILVHLIRMRGDMMASMLAVQPQNNFQSSDVQGIVDNLPFITFNES